LSITARLSKPEKVITAAHFAPRVPGLDHIENVSYSPFLAKGLAVFSRKKKGRMALFR
jgi:hypothetical protein